jgi:hypothetical protein
MPSFTRKLSELINEGFEFGLGPLDYPIWDETYREGLNSKILKHYWNYEIGQETESMFRFSLNRKMNEIMPYFNQLYLSTHIQFDPLQTMNYTDFTASTDQSNGTNDRTQNLADDRTTSNTSDTTASSDSNARSVSSQTPQVQLSNNEDYASSAADTTQSSSNTGHNSSSATDNVTHTGTDNISTSLTGNGTVNRTLQGRSGPSASELLMQYRATFLNIDMMVIKELETQFMQIWDNGDEYTHSEGILGYDYYTL